MLSPVVRLAQSNAVVAAVLTVWSWATGGDSSTWSAAVAVFLAIVLMDLVTLLVERGGRPTKARPSRDLVKSAVLGAAGVGGGYAAATLLLDAGDFVWQTLGVIVIGLAARDLMRIHLERRRLSF